MNPIKHPLCNDVLRKPEGMTEEECRDLHILREEDTVWSFWKPTDEQLVALNRGGCVAVYVQGHTHPPLSIFATHPTPGTEEKPVHESEYRHRMGALNGRLNALLALTKRIVAAWNRETKGGPSHVCLVDEFLDMINVNKADGSVVTTNPTP